MGSRLWAARASSSGQTACLRACREGLRPPASATKPRPCPRWRATEPVLDKSRIESEKRRPVAGRSGPCWQTVSEAERVRPRSQHTHPPPRRSTCSLSAPCAADHPPAYSVADRRPRQATDLGGQCSAFQTKDLGRRLLVAAGPAERLIEQAAFNGGERSFEVEPFFGQR